MEAAITEITLEPSLSACIMKQKGEGGVGVGWVWRASQAAFFITIVIVEGEIWKRSLKFEHVAPPPHKRFDCRYP